MNGELAPKEKQLILFCTLNIERYYIIEILFVYNYLTEESRGVELILFMLVSLDPVVLESVSEQIMGEIW